jgi:hypothetical protein
MTYANSKGKIIYNSRQHEYFTKNISYMLVAVKILIVIVDGQPMIGNCSSFNGEGNTLVLHCMLSYLDLFHLNIYGRGADKSLAL